MSNNSIIVADGGDFVGTAAYILRYWQSLGLALFKVMQNSPLRDFDRKQFHCKMSCDIRVTKSNQLYNNRSYLPLHFIYISVHQNHFNHLSLQIYWLLLISSFYL